MHVIACAKRIIAARPSHSIGARKAIASRPTPTRPKNPKWHPMPDLSVRNAPVLGLAPALGYHAQILKAPFP